MGVQFEEPWFLILFVPAVLWALVAWKRDVRLSGLTKRVVYTLRLLLIAALVLGASGLSWVQQIDRQHVIYVVDRSDSMREMGQLADWIERAETSKQEEDTSGIVAFAAAPVTERFADERPLTNIGFHARVDGTQTDIEQALLTARSLIPEGENGRIVLLSDGEETRGNMLRYAPLFQSDHIALDVLRWAPLAERPLDAAVEQLLVPQQMRQGETFTLEVVVQSTVAADGTLRLYENNQEIAAFPVQLTRGEQRFALQLEAERSGFHRYRAELYVDGDAEPRNDQAHAFANVSGPPQVLLVQAHAQTDRAVPELLTRAGIDYDWVTPAELPTDIMGYVRYDSIIVNNVGAEALGEAAMTRIEQAVRDYGMGLVKLGGDSGYGLGGYFDSPLERALPVYTDLRNERALPSLAVVYVLDRSSSMSGQPLNLAKEAAIRAIQLLRDEDTVGIVAFDSVPEWVLEPEPLADKELAIERMMSIAEGGGTDIYPALEEAYQMLKEADVQRRHVILLTDGHSASPDNYATLVAAMEEETITLSTVAIGDNADRDLLQRLAAQTGGRAYFAEDERSLPAIMSREALTVSRTYIVDEPFVPLYGQARDWLPLFQGSVPPVRVHIATTAKETAETVLHDPQDNPLLIRWQYGAGRSVAWTSDLEGVWSGEWSRWEHLPAWFGSIVSWTFPRFSSAPLQFDASIQDGEAELRVIHPELGWNGEVKAVVSDDDGIVTSLEFDPVRPGEYVARFTAAATGAYLARIDLFDAKRAEAPHVQLDAQPSATQIAGFVLPYSREYSLRSAVGDKLEELATETGGRILAYDQPEEVYAAPLHPTYETRSLTGLMLIFSIAIWLLDIAARRFGIPFVPVPQNIRETSAHRQRQTAVPNKSEARHVRPDSGVTEKGDAHPSAPNVKINDRNQENNERMGRLLAAKNRTSSQRKR